jgi:hypothetical protein
MAAYRPFLDNDFTNLQITNEIAFIILSYHQLMFTDYVQEPETKYMIGWSFVFLGLSNLFYPNIYLVVLSMWPDCKKACSRTKKLTGKELRRKLYLEGCEERRNALIKKYDLQLR